MCLEVEITEIGSTFHLMQAEVIMPCQLDTKLLNEKQLMCSYHYHFRLLYHFSQFYLKFLKVGYGFFYVMKFSKCGNKNHKKEYCNFKLGWFCNTSCYW